MAPEKDKQDKAVSKIEKAVKKALQKGVKKDVIARTLEDSLGNSMEPEKIAVAKNATRKPASKKSRSAKKTKVAADVAEAIHSRLLNRRVCRKCLVDRRHASHLNAD